MASISNDKIKMIKGWYGGGLCAREIAEKLNVSIDAVYYFFRRHNIPRRNPRENNILQFKKKKPSFKIKNNLSPKERELEIAGLMLYWAEGTARNHTVDFANSDENMIRLFLKFLRKICRVDEKRLRVFLYCYSNQNKNKLIRYWSHITNIPISQFTKPYIRSNYTMKAGRQMPYGLVHIRYSDKKLLMYLIEKKNKYVKEVNK